MLFIPIALIVFIGQQPDAFAVMCAVVAGILASVVPYVADLVTLRRVPANLFGILMSINPVFAAAIGAVALGESLGIMEWAGVLLIVGANASALLLRGSNPKH